MKDAKAPKTEYAPGVQPPWREYLRESFWLATCDPTQPLNLSATYQRKQPLVMPAPIWAVTCGCAALALAGLLVARGSWPNPNLNTIGVVLMFLALVLFLTDLGERRAARRYAQHRPAVVGAKTSTSGRAVRITPPLATAARTRHTRRRSRWS